MPELPEVETTCRGIRPHLTGRRIQLVTVRESRLRWPVPEEIEGIHGRMVQSVSRRAKYILIGLDSGAHILIHLGMSGSMRICKPDVEARLHDHIILSLDSGYQLRYHDPRRFGCWLLTGSNPMEHPLLAGLGPEPLETGFHADYLKCACHGRGTRIKQVLMNAKIVVGVGNIYACEALYLAGIHPRRPASNISLTRLEKLVDSVKHVLARSIAEGGTTLRDFVREDGQPGYFKQQLMVYDREGKPCRQCGAEIKRIILGQRSTFYCPRCQH